jgi:hypothetical protein
MYFSGTNGGGYSIGRATSPDGINWTEYSGNPVMVPQASWEGNRIHPGWFSVGVTGYDLYYDSGSPGAVPQIGHATSPDGVTWTRDAANPVLTPGAAGAWDAGAVAEPFLATVGSEVRMYFTGYSDLSNTLLQIGYATWTPGAVTYASAGEWFSPVFDSGDFNTTWITLSWTGATPPGTALSAFVQVGNTSLPDSTWVHYPASMTTPTALHLPEARYAQVVVALNSSNGSQTPALSAITVTYETPAASSPLGQFWGLGLAAFLVLLAAVIVVIVAVVVVLLLVLQPSRPPAPVSPGQTAFYPPPNARFCPTCGMHYPANYRVCPRDGTELKALQ